MSEFHAAKLPRVIQRHKLHAQIAFISANSQESARQYTKRIENYAAEHLQDVPDMAYTLALHRESLPYRAYMIFDGLSNTKISAVAKVPNEIPSVVMIFSGQGAQWPEMARELLQNDIHFRQDIQDIDQILQSFAYPPTWALKGK